ncbi:glycosyltransferase family 2 protein [Paracoccus marinaquae]|uniref:Glycosyltransferase family 2 protein n=1 Tax=Paracoccus marinaquae TaxID=2841926 RepID=A0ABS6AL14_9RHOB|nr:glycosyltransferase family 2 protein [Paracoccus marinaquae]MBU3031277.1 glycosyltransferase family 2 protein [Paracoccus marinaquae]
MAGKPPPPATKAPAATDLARIGSLWIGGDLSWLEIASLHSFVALGHDVALYAYDEIANVPPGVTLRDAREIWDSAGFVIHKESGSPAPHADIFRVMMVRQTGRVWVDTDVIALRPFALDIDWYLGHERQDKEELGNAILGLPAGSRLLEDLHAFLTDPHPVPPWMPQPRREKLAALWRAEPDFGFGDLAWGTSGPKALTHFARATGDIEHAQPQEMFFPVTFQERRMLLNPRRAEELDHRVSKAESRSVHLYSRWMRKASAREEAGLPPRDSWIGRWAAEHGIIGYPPVAGADPAQPAAEPARPDADERRRRHAQAQVTEREAMAAAEVALADLDQRKARIPGGANVSRHGRVTIVTMAKDEGPYVLEWVAHHHVLGFTDILAYTNDCTDGTDEMFDALAGLGLVTRLGNPPWKDKPPQSRALHWAEINSFAMESDWLLIMDLDEFVSIRGGGPRVDDLIDRILSQKATGMCLAWRFFGSAGLERFEPGPVTERMTAAAPESFVKGYGIKTLFRTDPHMALAIHRPYLKIRFARSKEGSDYPVNWLNGNGAALNGRDLRWRLNSHQVGYDLAQMNHYGVKSREEYLLRRLRGDVLDNHSKYDAEYFGVFDRNEVEDRSALALAGEREALVARLLKDPAVRAAADLIEARLQDRLARLRHSDGYREQMAELQPYPFDKAMKIKRK